MIIFSKFAEEIFVKIQWIMRNLIVFLVFSLVFVIPVSASDKETDSLMRVYDELLSKYEIYIVERHDRIDNLKFEAGKQFLTPQQLYSVNQQIYKEYRPYISDSAIVYLKKILLSQKILTMFDLADRIKNTTGLFARIYRFVQRISRFTG